MITRLALTVACFGLAAQVETADAATFYFIRHAESTTNTGEASTPEEMLDPPLTALGTQQALDLVETLAGVDLTNIYVSGYQRTALTIAPTAAEHGLTPVVMDEIGEWRFNPETLGDLYADLAQVMAAWAAGDTSASIEGAESLDDMNARILPGYQEIIDRHKDEDGVVAIVGHGGSIGWTMPFFASNVTPAFAFSNNLYNTGIVKVVLDEEGNPLVTEWLGIAFDANGPVPELAPVPLPATGLLLLCAMGGLGAARGLRRGRKAA